MKNLLTLIILISAFQSYCQVDRYNYVQRPTDSSVTIAWRTANQSIGTIQWGTDASNLSNTLSNVTATSKHYFDIVGLEPNTQYFYQTSTDGGFISDVDFFYTSKPKDVSGLKFLHYGDCGYNNNVQNDIAALMEAENAEFGVVAGDVDQGVGDNYDNIYFGVYEDILKNYCHFTAIGNHDTYYDNADTYLDAFYLPTNNPQETERYYSFTWGNAKFICLDSNIPYTYGTPQYDWLVSELQCTDHQWVFTFFHHPPWTNAWSADYYLPLTEYFLYEGNLDIRSDLVPLFEEYNVDFVLNGHSHCYQRGELNGVKYVISGGAGSSLLDFNTNSNSPNIDTEIYANQYVRFNVDGDTATYTCIDDGGNILDQVETIKTGWVSQTPTISFDGSDLVSSVGSSYEWYLDGVALTSETSQTISSPAFGLYQVVTTNQYGCSFTSDLFLYDGSGIGEKDQVTLSIYPNPSTGDFFINATADFVGVNPKVRVINLLGEVIYKERAIESFPCSVKLNSDKNGIYIIQVITDSGQSSHRVIVR